MASSATSLVGYLSTTIWYALIAPEKSPCFSRARPMLNSAIGAYLLYGALRMIEV